MSVLVIKLVFNTKRILPVSICLYIGSVMMNQTNPHFNYIEYNYMKNVVIQINITMHEIIEIISFLRR